MNAKPAKADDPDQVKVLRGAYHVSEYFVRRYPLRIALVVIFTFIIVGLEAVGASALLPLINEGLGSGDQSTIPFEAFYRNAFGYFGIEMSFYSLLGVMVVAWVFKILATISMGVYVDFSKEVVANDFRGRIIFSLERVRLPALAQRDSGIIVNLLNQEADKVASAFTLIPNILVSFVTFLVYLLFGLNVSVEMMAGILVLGLLSFYIVRPFFRMSYFSGRDQSLNLRSISNEAFNSLVAFKAFKAMGRESELLQALNQRNVELVANRLIQSKAVRFLHGSTEFMVLAMLVTGIVVGREFLEMGLAELGFLGVVLIKCYGRISTVQRKMQAIASLEFVQKNFEKTVSQIEAAYERNTGTTPAPSTFDIRFSNVSFKHGDHRILEDCSFDVPARGVTAIIGESGSGKTTIADLICGFYRPHAGKIEINGIDLASIDMMSWRGCIGYVTQTPLLLNDTVFRNVAAFSETISEADVKHAIEQAGLSKLVANLPDGLNTRIQEGGSRLSGGERQRLALARALAQKPKLLILDEPTSAVDPETERYLYESIGALRDEMPILVISHQEGAVMVADRVFRLKFGSMENVRKLRA